MGFLKGYFVGKKDGKDDKSKTMAGTATPPVELRNSMQVSSTSTPIGGMRGSHRSTMMTGSNLSMVDIKNDLMLTWLHEQQQNHNWITRGNGEGVILKRYRGEYVCLPRGLENDASQIFDIIKEMNLSVAMTIKNNTIQAYLQNMSVTIGGETLVPLLDGLRLQCLPSIEYLMTAQKHQCAAFIADVNMLVVWDDDPAEVLARAEKLQDMMIKAIFTEEVIDEKNGDEASVRVQEIDPNDPEGVLDIEEQGVTRRPTILINGLMIGLTLCLLVTALGFGWRNLLVQSLVDKNYLRLALLAMLPVTVFLCLFFMQIVVVSIMQMIGPISQMQTNSKFYSANAPKHLKREDGALPHVTIQCPVYKEGLTSVIAPTVKSVKAAISTYEMQGGSASIFINDDGMQLISREEAEARMEFYQDHNIGWVSRPKHNPNPKEGERPFIRKGKFKKASNMNYALMVSNKVEEKLALLNTDESWTRYQEAHETERCLTEVLDEEEGRAWADGNIRVGDYILLIDSDTRVPKDCLLDAVSEMEQSPEVGIMQYSSGVMNVSDNFFENGVTFFTNLIYTAIRYTVANGDVAPFVGHNAILRWSAIQEVSYQDEDGYEKFWSESHVSEDFDMSLRLQCAGYIIRLAAYAGDGYKEGVSLTVYDELARWEKYAYGCNELLFHPLRFWLVRGPFTKLFRTFLFSNIRFTSKITILSYIGTYYAIGASWILTVGNYFLVGWMNGYLDHWYLDSFKIYFSIIIVFNIVGNIALAVLRYRIGEGTIIGGLVGNFKWIPLLTIFLGGLSLHVSQALLSHMFEIDMTWGATAKEVEDTSFFKEIPKVFKKFKITFLFCFLCIGGMIALALFVPPLWRINSFIAIYPLSAVVISHFLLPIVLNPALMLFTW